MLVALLVQSGATAIEIVENIESIDIIPSIYGGNVDSIPHI